MKREIVNWEKRRAEDPLSMARRSELRRMCIERGIEFDPKNESARDLRDKLRKHAETAQPAPPPPPPEPDPGPVITGQENAEDSA